MATRMATYPSAYQQQHPSSSNHTSQRTYVSPWGPPPYQGAPPIPPGVAVNPQQWSSGVWQFNPAYNQNRSQNQQHVPWIPSHHWQQQQQPKPQAVSQASQQAAQQQQQQQQQQPHNPYKRTPRAPSAEYLATALVDNPLGLHNMIPAEEYYKQSEVQTPWIWKPRELDDADDDAGTSTSNVRRHASEPIINGNHSGPLAEPEVFTSKKELQPTFSSRIVRTPDHYRQDSSSSPSSSRNSSSRSSRSSLEGRMSQLSIGSSNNNDTSPTPLSRHSSVPNSSTAPEFQFSAPILAAQLSDEPDSMLSPLIIASTPKPGGPAPLRPVRTHHSNPIIGGPLDPIPEGPAPKDRDTQKDTASARIPTKDREYHHSYNHSNSLPSPPKSQGSFTYPQSHQIPQYPPPPPLPRAGSRHTTATFIDPPIFSSLSPTFPSNPAPASATPHPHLSIPAVNQSSSSSPKTPSPRSGAPSRSSSRPSSRTSSAHDSPVNPSSGGPFHVTPPSNNHPTSPPASSSASASTFLPSTHTSNPLPPPPKPIHRTPKIPRQKTPPPGWRTRVRHGFWNRRGDHLTNDGYLVYAPPDKVYPDDLRNHPEEGYQNHDGQWTKYVNRPELPESLPRQGKCPECPYEAWVVWEYKM